MRIQKTDKAQNMRKLTTTHEETKLQAKYEERRRSAGSQSGSHCEEMVKLKVETIKDDQAIAMLVDNQSLSTEDMEQETNWRKINH